MPSRSGWPKIEVRPALSLLALFVAIATAQGLAMGVARHGRWPDGVPVELIGFLSGAIGAWVALPVVQMVVARVNDSPRDMGHLLALHLVGYAVFTTIHTSVMVALRVLAGLISTRIGERFASIPMQVVYEVPADLILYPALAGLWHLLRAREDQREVALRTAELERALAETRLGALAARIDPHFLFNALHTVSAMMHEDLPRTDRLLARLGDVLRWSFEADRPTWTLEEEQALTSSYVEIQRARLGDRLQVSWSTDPSASIAASSVPRFAIQSLVENAVKHNEAREAPLVVTIDTRIEAAALLVRVSDDGVGFDAPALRPLGHGLSRLDEVLRLAFGEAASLSQRRSALGGAEVVLSIPQSMEAGR